MKRLIELLCACALLFHVSGCATTKLIPLNEVSGSYDGRVIAWLSDGSVIKSDTGYSIIRSDTLVTAINDQTTTIPLSEIRVFQVRKLNLGQTIAAIAAGWFVIGVTIMAVSGGPSISNGG